MVISVPDSDLVCTFFCRFETEKITAKDASDHLILINYSAPAIKRREKITSFKSSYSQLTRTVSIFTRNDRERLSLITLCQGAPYYEDTCSRFDIHGSRLRCQLASSAVEVAFFSATFPPVPVTASGIGHYIHPSMARRALISQSLNERIAPGILFVHVALMGQNTPSTRLKTMKTASGDFKVPESLADSLRSMYRGGGVYPYYMEELLSCINNQSNLLVD